MCRTRLSRRARPKHPANADRLVALRPHRHRATPLRGLPPISASRRDAPAIAPDSLLPYPLKSSFRRRARHDLSCAVHGRVKAPRATHSSRSLQQSRHHRPCCRRQTRAAPERPASHPCARPRALRRYVSRARRSCDDCALHPRFSLRQFLANHMPRHCFPPGIGILPG